jgi:serine/threonine protein phosphatase PrpC
MPDQAALWGADHVQLGEIAVESVGSNGAIAISRGAEPKGYPSGSPNEDAVAAVVGPRATLLAVADGHDGYDSVPAALGSVLKAFGSDPPPADLDDGELVAIFAASNEAALRATGGGYADDESSRTTLAIALLAEGRLQWASFGDSSVLVSEAAGVRPLSSPRLKFIGYPMGHSEVAELLDHGSADLGTCSWMLLASDGLIDYAGGGELDVSDAIAAQLHTASHPAMAAEALVRAAFAGGAGDNVAVALARLG